MCVIAVSEVLVCFHFNFSSFFLVFFPLLIFFFCSFLRPLIFIYFCVQLYGALVDIVTADHSDAFIVKIKPARKESTRTLLLSYRPHLHFDACRIIVAGMQYAPLLTTNNNKINNNTTNISNTHYDDETEMCNIKTLLIFSLLQSPLCLIGIWVLPLTRMKCVWVTQWVKGQVGKCFGLSGTAFQSSQRYTHHVFISFEIHFAFVVSPPFLLPLPLPSSPPLSSLSSFLVSLVSCPLSLCHWLLALIQPILFSCHFSLPFIPLIPPFFLPFFLPPFPSSPLSSVSCRTSSLPRNEMLSCVKRTC